MHTLTASGHDSAVHFVYPTAQPPVLSVKTSGLPYKVVMYLNDGTVIVGGHDNSPVLLQWDSNENAWLVQMRA